LYQAVTFGIRQAISKRCLFAEVQIVKQEPRHFNSCALMGSDQPHEYGFLTAYTVQESSNTLQNGRELFFSRVPKQKKSSYGLGHIIV